MNTPRTDNACGWPWGHHGRIECGDLRWSPDGPFVHSSVARQLERDNFALRERVEAWKKEAVEHGAKLHALEHENAALREVLRMAKRYVPPQAVTNEWRSKPASECRLLDKIESVLGEEAQP